VTLAFAATVGILFGAGSYLVLKRDLFRVVIGVVVIANAANVALMAAGRTRGSAPVDPAEQPVSDPLPQALTLTAVVIGFATAALLFAIVYRVYRTHATVDFRELSRAESERARAEDREELTL
jgi:multicomponent Na+:H+ antiporter subunit C